MAKKHVRLTHRISGVLLAEGPLRWGITPFEGNYYIGRKYLRTAGFKANYVPGICFCKFLCVWMDYRWGPGENEISKFMGWMYSLPNPLMPHIWYRVAVPWHHPELLIEEYVADSIQEPAG